MREFGCTRVELGVQIIDDKVYKKINRGHSVKDVAEATKELRNAGFKIGYHIMPGLPGSNIKKDLQLFKKIFSDERFKPDQIKIYPCQVMPGSELENWYWKRKYKPYSKEQIEKILIEMLKIVPRYCRVMRVMREIPPDYIVAGTTKIDLRKDIEEELRKNKIKLKEIRFREIGFALRDNLLSHLPNPNNLKLKVTKYRASEGDEYFLEIVDNNNILFGLLRLRLNKKWAMVRELHVYGQALKLGDSKKSEIFGATKSKLSLRSDEIKDFVGRSKSVQHIGLGKWLLSEAEKITKKNKINEIKIISGVGVRDYYKRLGYVLEKGKGEYLVKKI